MAKISFHKEYLDSRITINVIIVNYNAGVRLLDCLRSACAQVNGEIVVVDNASSDCSSAAGNIIEFGRRLPHVIRNSVNLGFSKACNVGMRSVSGGDFTLFLNPDAVLVDGALARMVEILDSQPDIGMVGGLLANSDGSEQVGGRRLIPTPKRAIVRALGLHRLNRYWPNLFSNFDLHKQPLPQYPTEVEAISGACMLVKREAIEDVGLWDEGYFLHCEDLDWCMRFRQKGWKIMFVPDAKVVHYKGTCSKSRPIFVEWHKHKGMVRFYRKFFRQRYPSVLMWLVFVGVWVRFSVLATYYAARHLGRRLGIGRG